MRLQGWSPGRKGGIVNDNLLGAPRKGATIKETSRLGRKGSIIMTDNLLGAPRKGATVKETWGLRREAL